MRLFKSYKDCVRKTLDILSVGDLSSTDAVATLEMFFHDNEICADSLEAKQYMSILRTMNFDVMRRKGVWYFGKQPVKMFEI